MTFNRQLSGDWKNLCPGFGDLFRKAAMLHHPGNLISTYPTPCFYKRHMTTEKDDVLFCFLFFQEKCFLQERYSSWPIFLKAVLALIMLFTAKDAKPKTYSLKVIDDPDCQRRVTCLLTGWLLR